MTFAPGTSLPLHYHTGPAEVYTLKGRWVYSEYPDQPQTAGTYLYEPGGSVHTLYVPEGNTEDTVLFVRVAGANINFDDNGLLHSILDTLTIRVIADSGRAERVCGCGPRVQPDRQPGADRAEGRAEREQPEQSRPGADRGRA